MKIKIYLSAICFFTLLICNGCKDDNQCTGPKPTINKQETEQKTKDTSKAPIIKVYVENSGSMDGYVKGTTDFESAVYSYLSDLKLADLGMKKGKNNIINLNYINSEIIEFRSDVKDFIDKLEPDVFKQRGGDRGASDISVIIDSILVNTGKNDVSVFISDCIFSPGKAYKNKDDADEYLNSQQIGIKENFATKIKDDKDFSVIIYRLTSQFDGYYYNKFDDPTYFNGSRPFYIWLMGNRQELRKITDRVNVKKKKDSGVKNIFSASPSDNNIDYGFVKSRCIGDFDIDTKNSKNTIIDAHPESKGSGNQFCLAIGVDLSKTILQDEYVTNANNYTISDKKYKLSVEKNKKSDSKYTHIIKIQTSSPIISKGIIKITLKNNMPSWVDICTDKEGLDINKGDAKNKTYGLKYLIGGVFDAFTYNTAEPEYFTLKINIK